MCTGPPCPTLREHIDDVPRMRFFQAGVSHVQNCFCSLVWHIVKETLGNGPFSDKKITCADHDPYRTQTMHSLFELPMEGRLLVVSGTGKKQTQTNNGTAKGRTFTVTYSLQHHLLFLYIAFIAICM